MISTNTSAQTSDDDLFTVANLALWAGDAANARRNLSEILRRNQATQGSVSVFVNPLVSSAQRVLRQLDRRIAEYRRLGQSLELSTDQTQSREALQSSGGHLAAMIWAETERTFELRSYLIELSWEADFYKRCATLSGKDVALKGIVSLGYGRDISGEQVQGTDEAQRVDALELAWAITRGEMFLEIEVSDLCTLTAHSVWIGKEPPETSDQLVAVFQKVLDEIDPGDSQQISKRE